MFEKKKGRPPLPEGEKLVKVNARIPQQMLDACRERGPLSTVIREALAVYLDP